MQRGARGEAAATVGIGGISAAVHEFFENEPNIEVTAGGVQAIEPADIGPEASVQPSVQRSNGTKANPQLAAAMAEIAAIDAGPIPRHFGTRFELEILARAMRGELVGMSGVVHAFRAQYNASGHGIDIIAVGRGEGGKLKLWQIECKWVESFFKPELKSRKTGIQTSASWTKEGFKRWLKAATPADKAQLFAAVRTANGGRAVSETRLIKLVSEAEVIVTAPLAAASAELLSRVFGTMGALIRHQRRQMRFLPFRTP